MLKSLDPGIYSIIHLESGKTYIGSTGNLKNRWKAHRTELCAGIHKNRHMQNVVNKYGIDSMQFSIVTRCDVEDLIQLEQAHIDAVPKELRFNHRVVVQSNLGMKLSEESRLARPPYKPRPPITDETRRRMSEAKKGARKGVPMPKDEKWRKSISESRKGKIPKNLFTEEATKARMDGIQARVGKPRKKPIPKSEETIRKLSEAGKSRSMDHLHDPEIRKKQGLAQRGRKVSAEGRERMRLAALNRKPRALQVVVAPPREVKVKKVLDKRVAERIPRTPEHKANIAAAQKARWAAKKAAAQALEAKEPNG